MPIDYAVHPEPSVVSVEVSGELSDDDVLSTIEGIRSDPDWDPSFSQLVVVDARDADPTDLSSETLGVAARRVRQIAEDSPGAIKVAIVVVEPVQYGLARVFQSLYDSGDEGRVRIFRSIEPALEWLEGLSRDMLVGDY